MAFQFTAPEAINTDVAINENEKTQEAVAVEENNAKSSERTSCFSKSWKGSDVILQVESKDIHAHRFILSMQCDVFEAMFNSEYAETTKEKVELKDDKYEPMIDFLLLLYPANMMNEEVKLRDENILQVLEIADKYGAINVVKQCMKKVRKIRPKTAMHLLPYAARFNLPTDVITDVIVRHVSAKDLKSFFTRN
ncbi:BTB and MATH domain-containing protein 42-like [Xenia sp. Carnegie-2017]|uniref:BTB and MATH domain-containing protein 42-like n=1 Tax=Xenia sp. Carnegie-2017 TaxID=2897299 RepID=UPI001F04489F|nr:BTB and MATH domain-containing protein 42-like [Xenia sp. Carnegie-2017]